jgi:superfamily II DNA or RNA helicase
MKKIQIQFRPNFCTIMTPLSDEVNTSLHDHLAFHPNGYFFSPKFQAYVNAKSANLAMIQVGKEPIFNLKDFNLWDGYIRLYKVQQQSFKTGLLKRVQEILMFQFGWDIELIDAPEKKELIQHVNTYTLRSYQWDIGNIVVSERFGIIKAPARSGKTIMAASIIDSEEEYPAVFFCRSIDIARQTRDIFVKIFSEGEVGMTGDGECDIKAINVMTIQSVYSAFNTAFKEKVDYVEKAVENKLAVKQLIKKAKIIFYDECHHSQSETSAFVLDKCIEATMKIGLSATPHHDTESDLPIENIMGTIIAEVSYSELILEGFLLRPYIYMYRLPKDNSNDAYQTIYKTQIVENEFLNGLICKIVKKLNDIGESIVVQTEQIAHTKKLAKMLGCGFLTGKETGVHREEVIQQLREKKILCLVSTLFEEGIDIPTLGYTINVAGGLSNISTFQRMRSITTNKETDKNTCGIIDFLHQCKYLHRHSLTRRRQYRSEPEFVYEERNVSKKTLEEIH